MRVVITGLGVWTAAHPGLQAWREDVVSDPPATPVGEGIPPRARRRATPIARMAADVLTEALAQSGRSGAEVDLLLASVGGELGNTVSTLHLLGDDPPASSPLRFGSSVHNAALGQLAIPWGNERFASALAARHDRIVATGLLEAMGRVLSGTGDAAVVFADETWPIDGAPAVAVALVLSAEPAEGATVWAHLAGVAREVAEDRPSGTPDPARSASPVRDALALVDALVEAWRGPVAIGAPDADGLRWVARLEAP